MEQKPDAEEGAPVALVAVVTTHLVKATLVDRKRAREELSNTEDPREPESDTRGKARMRSETNAERAREMVARADAATSQRTERVVKGTPTPRKRQANRMRPPTAPTRTPWLVPLAEAGLAETVAQEPVDVSDNPLFQVLAEERTQKDEVQAPTAGAAEEIAAASEMTAAEIATNRPDQPAVGVKSEECEEPNRSRPRRSDAEVEDEEERECIKEKVGRASRRIREVHARIQRLEQERTAKQTAEENEPVASGASSQPPPKEATPTRGGMARTMSRWMARGLDLVVKVIRGKRPREEDTASELS